MTTTTTITTQQTQPPDSLLTDPWTPDQESTLLRALIRYKPIGLHAHFRMIAIRNQLLASGTVNPDGDEHTRIPGIWTKLDSLYDLARLDEREDAIIYGGRSSGDVDGGDGGEDDDEEEEEEEDGDGDGEVGSPTSGVNRKRRRKDDEYWREFELPCHDGQGEWEGMMWERRLAPSGEGNESDAEEWSVTGAGGGGGARESTVEEMRSSPLTGAGSSTPTTTRETRASGRTTRGGRLSKLRDESVADVEGSTRSSRRTSKAASPVVDEDGDRAMTEDGDEDGDDGNDESESEAASDEPDDEEKRGTANKRGRGGRRGRGKRGRRRG